MRWSKPPSIRATCGAAACSSGDSRRLHCCRADGRVIAHGCCQLRRSSRFESALLGSARLIGLGASDVRQALDRSEAEGLGKRRLKDLGPLEQRLVGLAHGLSSDPELLLLEDSCEGLEDDDAELLLSALERAIVGRSWILGSELRSPWSRRLAQAAELALTAEGGTLLGPIRTADLASPGLWARFDRVSEELMAALIGRAPRSSARRAKRFSWSGGSGASPSRRWRPGSALACSN